MDTDITPHSDTAPGDTATLTRSTAFADLPALLTVGEVRAYLDCGRTTAYAIARERGIRYGRLLRVPRERLAQ